LQAESVGKGTSGSEMGRTFVQQSAEQTTMALVMNCNVSQDMASWNFCCFIWITLHLLLLLLLASHFFMFSRSHSCLELSHVQANEAKGEEGEKREEGKEKKSINNEKVMENWGDGKWVALQKAKHQPERENWKSFSDTFWIMMMIFPFSIAFSHSFNSGRASVLRAKHSKAKQPTPNQTGRQRNRFSHFGVLWKVWSFSSLIFHSFLFHSFPFTHSYILEQHQFLHRDKTLTCRLPNCIYIGRTWTDMRNHNLLSHNDEKLFICTQPNCDYQAETMEQLRR